MLNTLEFSNQLAFFGVAQTLLLKLTQTLFIKILINNIVK
jgi:hypothetical protein